MTIFKTNVKILNTFLKHFNGVFSKKQFLVFSFFFYALFKEYKRCSIQAIAQKTSMDYQKLQYFLSEAKWSIHELNNKRINLIQSQRTTASTKGGALIIDDSANPKPFSKATEGAKYQYCAPLKREEVCNVFVASCFASKNKYFPVDLEFYKPASEFKHGKNSAGFKSKIDIAYDLLNNAVSKNISFDTILFDSWYCTSELIHHACCNMNKHVISELKSNRKLMFFHPQLKHHLLLRADKIVTLVKKFYPHKLKPVKVKQADGKQVTNWFYHFKSTLKNCSIPFKVVVMFGKWGDKDEQNYHILISSNHRTSAPNIISTYTLRWCIEKTFQQLKDSFALDQYQVRSKISIERYWHICLLAWTFVFWIKQNAYLSKITVNHQNSSSFNDFKAAINSLINCSSVSIISKSDSPEKAFFNIKSQRFINHLRKSA